MNLCYGDIVKIRPDYVSWWQTRHQVKKCPSGITSLLTSCGWPDREYKIVSISIHKEREYTLENFEEYTFCADELIFVRRPVSQKMTTSMQTTAERLTEILLNKPEVLRSAGTSASATLQLIDHLLENDVTVQVWNSVDNPPPDNTDVIAYVHEKDGAEYYAPILYKDGGWWDCGTYHLNTCVTHWTPLPDPPKR